MKSKILLTLLTILATQLSARGSEPLIDSSSQWYRKNLLDTPSIERIKPSEHPVDWFLIQRVRPAVRFDPTAWRSTTDRLELLSAFVYDYPVIGMSRSEIHKLLGETLKELEKNNRDIYVVGGGRKCALMGTPPNPLIFFELSYSNDKVDGFRTYSIGSKTRPRGQRQN